MQLLVLVINLSLTSDLVSVSVFLPALCSVSQVVKRGYVDWNGQTYASGSEQ